MVWLKCSLRPRYRAATIVLFSVALSTLSMAARAHACADLSSGADPSDLRLCIEYYGSNVFRLPNVTRTLWNPAIGGLETKHADGVVSQRNEVRIIADWIPSKHLDEKLFGGVPVKFHIELRPWWDAAYSLTGWGQGQYAKYLAPFWENNLEGLQTYSDPIFREYYADISPENFFIRVGSQIISWGKSDGIYMLDILNPFNYRTLGVFNEELIKIPVWAINANWSPSAGNTLQFVYEPVYFPSQYPGQHVREGGYHDWTFGSVNYFNNIFNQFGIPLQDRRMPDFGIDNGTYGVRWSSQIGKVRYTLNYLYGFTPFPIYRPNTGNTLTGTQYSLEPHRIQVAGGSFDYSLATDNWLDGTVIRAESSVTNGNVYYEGTFGQPKHVTNWGMLLGIDKYLLSEVLEKPVFASFQYWHDMVLNGTHCADCGPESGDYIDIGFQGSPSGMRGPYKSLLTLFLDKTWLPGDTLDTQFFALYELQFHDWFLRPSATYRFNDDLAFTVGTNIYAGGKQTPYGEYTNLTNLFFEIRYQLL
ncbi:MAG: hypothetical protein Q7T82_15380 [Armatimonadota bacterium]|nr:hypothetical protein [Armatimonadota bacterium]